MSSMIQSSQYAEFGGIADGKKEIKNQKEQQMKLMRDQDIKEMNVPGNTMIKSTKQKQIEYLKQIKFNGFSSTQS
jgi:hypothetical protein